MSLSRRAFVAAANTGSAAFTILPEGYGAGSQCKHAEGMCQGGPEAHWAQFLPIIHGHIGFVADTGKPHRYNEQNTNKELHSTQRPMQIGGASSVLAEGNACLLVKNIVVDVANIPNNQVERQLRLLVPNGAQGPLSAATTLGSIVEVSV